MQTTAGPSQKDLNAINKLVPRLFRLGAEIAELKSRHQKAIERYKAHLERLTSQYGGVKEQLLKIAASVTPPEGKASFQTLYGSFHSRTDPVSFKVTNEKEVLRIAAELGITRLVSIEEVTTNTVVIPERLEEYLKVHPEVADKFEKCVRPSGSVTHRWITPDVALDETFGGRTHPQSISLTGND